MDKPFLVFFFNSGNAVACIAFQKFVKGHVAPVKPSLFWVRTLPQAFPVFFGIETYWSFPEASLPCH